MLLCNNIAIARTQRSKDAENFPLRATRADGAVAGLRDRSAFTVNFSPHIGG
jgi:hypothetical protein